MRKMRTPGTLTQLVTPHVQATIAEGPWLVGIANPLFLQAFLKSNRPLYNNFGQTFPTSRIIWNLIPRNLILPLLTSILGKCKQCSSASEAQSCRARAPRQGARGPSRRRRERRLPRSVPPASLPPRHGRGAGTHGPSHAVRRRYLEAR